jgi:hypothetical protein
MKYTSKPITVDAVRYDAPDTDDSEGNLLELSDFAGVLIDKQAPWHPSAGQNCLLIKPPAVVTEYDVDGNPVAWDEPPPRLVQPGDYVINTGGGLIVMDGGKFEAIYDTASATQSPAPSTDPDTETK